MIEERRNKCGNLVYESEDMDGDGFSIEFYGNDAIEILAESETGCIVLERSAAIEFAKKILERMK